MAEFLVMKSTLAEEVIEGSVCSAPISGGKSWVNRGSDNQDRRRRMSAVPANADFSGSLATLAGAKLTQS